MTTGDVIKYLQNCTDQTASTTDIVKYFNAREFRVLIVLERLIHIGRVEKIFNNLWHLE